MSVALAHRLRWFLVWILVASWFAGLAFKWLGDWLNVLLLLAIALVVYELLADDRDGADEGEPSDDVMALKLGGPPKR